MAPVLKKKRYMLLAAATVAAILVALAPFFLSSSPALRFFLAAVNNRIPGTLTVESWLVGWQQGILCQHIVYVNPDQGIRITIPRVTSTQGLLEIMLAPRNLGTYVVDSPSVELTRRRSTAPVTAAAGPPPVPESNADAGSVPLWDKLILDLQVRDGQFKIHQDDKERVAGIRNLRVDSNLRGGVVTFDLDFHSIEGQGIVKTKGSLNLPARRHGWLDTLIADVELSVISFQLQDLLSFAAANSQLPSGEGVLNADLRIKAVGIEGVQVNGLADLSDVKLGGGVLGEDTPSFRKINLNVEGGRWSGKGWTVKQVDLSCDIGELNGSGQYGGEGAELRSQGRINLPVLFDQFPHRMRVQEAAFIETGGFDFDINLTSAGETQNLELKARADNIGGLYDGKGFTWTSPVAIILNGSRKDREILVHALKLDAPFLHVEGRGDLNSFVLDASADLDKTFAEVGRLFKLNWDGNGKVEMALKGKVFSLDDERVKIETDMTISDFSLRRSGTIVVPHHQFSLLGSVKAPLNWLWRKKGALDLQFAFSSWLGEIFLAMNGEKLEDKPFRGYYSTDSTINLDSVTGLLHVFELLPGDASMAGDLEFQTAGYIEEDGLEVRELNSEINGFVLVRDGVVLDDKKVSLEIEQSVNDEIPSFVLRDLIVAENRDKFFRTGAGSNQVRFSDHSLFLHNISLNAESGSVTLKELIVPDWRNPLDALAVQMGSAVRLDRLSTLLHGTKYLGPDIDLAGNAAMNLVADKDKEGTGEIRIGLDLSDFGLTMQKKDVMVREKINFSANLLTLADGNINIRELLIASSPLDLSAAGTLKKTGERQEIELAGDMSPKLDKVSAILRSGFEVDLQMTGAQQESFLLRFPLAGVKKDEVILVTSLHADQAQYRGIDVHDLRIPVSIENKKLHLEISGQLNGGKLDLIADSDFAADPAVLKVPDNSQVMTGVQLQKALVDELLAGIHPLFGIMARPSGQLDVRLDSFSWPLQKDGGSDAVFVTVFDIREVDLASDGILKEVLAGFGLDREPLKPRDAEMYCIGRFGRITCSPVRILAADSEMVISGSVGLDRTLDYLVEIPVTAKLVGKEAYRILEGTTVRVPITGTTDKPAFDKKMVAAAVKDLVRQAAEKALLREAEKILPGLIEDAVGKKKQQ